MQISKTESNEFWMLNLEEGNTALECFLRRKRKHLYYIDDTPEKFIILSNRNDKKNFSLYETETNQRKEIYWKTIVDHKDDELIEDFL